MLEIVLDLLFDFKVVASIQEVLHLLFDLIRDNVWLDKGQLRLIHTELLFY